MTWPLRRVVAVGGRRRDRLEAELLGTDADLQIAVTAAGKTVGGDAHGSAVGQHQVGQPGREHPG